jgi:predicted methyltransferase
MNWRGKVKQEADPNCKACNGKGVFWQDVRDFEGCADVEEVRCYVCIKENK